MQRKMAYQNRWCIACSACFSCLFLQLQWLMWVNISILWWLYTGMIWNADSVAVVVYKKEILFCELGFYIYLSHNTSGFNWLFTWQAEVGTFWVAALSECTAVKLTLTVLEGVPCYLLRRSRSWLKSTLLISLVFNMIKPGGWVGGQKGVRFKHN